MVFGIWFLKRNKMFDPNINDVRKFFINIWSKALNNAPLDAMESMAYSVILQHPEYHYVLKDKDKYLNYVWSPDKDETNPFLHFSMHLSILEQLSIDQPSGISELYKTLCVKFGDRHDADHQLMDCMAEMIWQSQYTNNVLNPMIYLNCLRGKIDSK